MCIYTHVDIHISAGTHTYVHSQVNTHTHTHMHADTHTIQVTKLILTDNEH